MLSSMGFTNRGESTRSEPPIVTTYPPVPQATYPELLRHADLDKREPAVVLAARKPRPHLPTVRRKR